MKIKLNKKKAVALKSRVLKLLGAAAPKPVKAAALKNSEAMRQRVEALLGQRISRPPPTSMRPVPSRPTRPVPQRPKGRPVTGRSPAPMDYPAPAAEQVIEAKPINVEAFPEEVGNSDFGGMSAADAAFHGRDGFGGFDDLESDLGLAD